MCITVPYVLSLFGSDIISQIICTFILGQTPKWIMSKDYTGINSSAISSATQARDFVKKYIADTYNIKVSAKHVPSKVENDKYRICAPYGESLPESLLKDFPSLKYGKNQIEGKACAFSENIFTMVRKIKEAAANTSLLKDEAEYFNLIAKEAFKTSKVPTSKRKEVEALSIKVSDLINTAKQIPKLWEEKKSEVRKLEGELTKLFLFSDVEEVSDAYERLTANIISLARGNKKPDQTQKEIKLYELPTSIAEILRNEYVLSEEKAMPIAESLIQRIKDAHPNQIDVELMRGLALKKRELKPRQKSGTKPQSMRLVTNEILSILSQNPAVLDELRNDSFPQNKDLSSYDGVVDIVLKKLGRSYLYTDAEKQALEAFEGKGGRAKEGDTDIGILNEFFTPYSIIEKMWGLALKHGYQGGKVLEPSAGTGRFFKYLSKDIPVLAIEPSQINSYIIQALYPEVEVHNGYFEELFYDFKMRSKRGFSLVIGNPPYDSFKSPYSKEEKKKVPAVNFHDYMIARGLDLLEPDGLLIMIVPSNFMRAENAYNAVKKYIDERGDLIDGYRLPNNSFKNTYVGTDILVFKKKQDSLWRHTGL